MKTTYEICRFVKRHWWASAAILALALGQNLLAGDVHLDMLKTRTDSFKNVTVYNQSKTDIFIKHERGIASIKFTELDVETLELLVQSGYSIKLPASTGKSVTTVHARELSPGTNEAPATVSDSKWNVISESKLSPELREKIMPAVTPLMELASRQISPKVIWAVLGGLAIAYLFLCFCFKQICTKAGSEPGFLIWLPVLQLFPLLRAAGMSGWWFLAWLLPVLNIIAQIVWSFKIVQARGKNVLVAIGLLLPITNLFSLLYLAFSEGGGNQGNQPARRPVINGVPVFAEA